ncbi:hypothetical protein B0O99DRAFT_742624 [Bisporella sp. PMI_857]|nr:hypothetical protein B0O99DRAFT_742624 [Bisporella sp. PMI_857]
MSFRRMTQDFDILGHKIPKDTQIWLITAEISYNTRSEPFVVDEQKRSSSSRAAHKDRPFKQWSTDRWPLTEFVPERWLETVSNGMENGVAGEVCFNPNAGPSLSFIKGLRGCPRKQIATMEIKLMIAMSVLPFLRIEQVGNWERNNSLNSRAKQCFIRLPPSPITNKAIVA